ncbi:MAG: hypothetical protein FJW88_13540 [Actinobacteria bacterium]|nr:hypothetical protein [Actinomycetota bacterium]
MTDYYEILGVEPDASKDEIRGAYRDALEVATDPGERARLNKAWNTLSDPAQRARFDERRAAGEVKEGDDIEVLDAAAPAPASGGRRNQLPPTVVLPAGMRLAEPKARGMAMLFDFSVLAVLYLIVVAAVLPALLQSRYPEQTDRIDAIDKQITSLDKRQQKADDTADDDKATKAEREKAEADSKQLGKQIDDLEEQRADVAGDFQGFSLILIAALLVLCLAYVVPSTALTGQTLGMRLRRVKVVRIDGSPATWGSALARFVPPITLAVFLSQLGALLGLGMVLWFFRDRNRQGLHDRLAKTLVVEA